MNAFELHPQLAADTFPVADLSLCRVLLMNDARYPWLILVPRRPELRDLHDVDASESAVLFSEIRRTSQALDRLYSPFKINVAALGNQVPQLHIHVIARFEDDPAWPGPVWGVGKGLAYSEGADSKTLEALRVTLQDKLVD